MNFVNLLLRGIGFIPALVSGIEGMYALTTVDAVANREIVDPEKFKDGMSKIIDGTVECLNASTWAKGVNVTPVAAP
ncbi:MAG: hypothetical protein ABSG34_07245 [Candidatus Sulfotelmatobacter sp.]